MFLSRKKQQKIKILWRISATTLRGRSLWSISGRKCRARSVDMICMLTVMEWAANAFRGIFDDVEVKKIIKFLNHLNCRQLEMNPGFQLFTISKLLPLKFKFKTWGVSKILPQNKPWFQDNFWLLSFKMIQNKQGNWLIN